MTKGIKIKVGNLPTFYLLVPFREKQSEIEKSQGFLKKRFFDSLRMTIKKLRLSSGVSIYIKKYFYDSAGFSECFTLTVSSVASFS
jgi:hypothetical protein